MASSPSVSTLVFTLLLVTLAGSALASPSLKVFPLQHRTVEEVLPVIAPFVGEQGAVSGQGFTLIVRASPQILAEIEQILAEIDAKPKMLKISVRQGGDNHLDEKQFGADVSIRAGDHLSASSGLNPAPGSSSIQYGSDNLGVRGSALEMHTTERDSSIQQVTTLDGQQANISVGLSVPYPVRSYDSQGHYQESIEFRDVVTGFIVQPRLRGDQVIVEISPQAQKLHDQGRDIIDIRQLNTKVRGRLGEWMRIGGIDERTEGSQQGLLYQAGSSLQESHDVFLKVEQLE